VGGRKEKKKKTKNVDDEINNAVAQLKIILID
jgi:hypothetical protein